MAETELSFGDVVGLETFKEFGGMKTNPAKEFGGRFGGVARNVDCSFDGTGKDRFGDAEYDCGFFRRLGEVELQ